ncbi:MAG: DUF4071 domain-containing protein [Magnetococcus sp. YQC-9]
MHQQIELLDRAMKQLADPGYEHALGKLKQEKLCLEGRISKDKWRLSGEEWQGNNLLQDAAQAYNPAFVESKGQNHFAAINAATLFFLYGNEGLGKRLAERVLALCAAKTGEAGGDYWVPETMGEASLLLGLEQKAVDSYALARQGALKEGAMSALASMLRQIRLIERILPVSKGLSIADGGKDTRFNGVWGKAPRFAFDFLPEGHHVLSSLVGRSGRKRSVLPTVPRLLLVWLLLPLLFIPTGRLFAAEPQKTPFVSPSIAMQAGQAGGQTYEEAIQQLRNFEHQYINKQNLHSKREDPYLRWIMAALFLIIWFSVPVKQERHLDWADRQLLRYRFLVTIWVITFTNFLFFMPIVLLLFWCKSCEGFFAGLAARLGIFIMGLLCLDGKFLKAAFESEPPNGTVYTLAKGEFLNDSQASTPVSAPAERQKPSLSLCAECNGDVGLERIILCSYCCINICFDCIGKHHESCPKPPAKNEGSSCPHPQEAEGELPESTLPAFYRLPLEQRREQPPPRPPFYSGERPHKAYCRECGERYQDENLDYCTECGQPVCFRCDHEHVGSCYFPRVLERLECHLEGMDSSAVTSEDMGLTLRQYDKNAWLAAAISQRLHRCVNRLLHFGAAPNTVVDKKHSYSEKESVLCRAISSGDPELTRLLLQVGADPTWRKDADNPLPEALLQAITTNQAIVVEIILNALDATTLPSKALDEQIRNHARLLERFHVQESNGHRLDTRIQSAETIIILLEKIRNQGNLTPELASTIETAEPGLPAKDGDTNQVGRSGDA